jgi:hypothetical protein
LQAIFAIFTGFTEIVSGGKRYAEVTGGKRKGYDFCAEDKTGRALTSGAQRAARAQAF